MKLARKIELLSPAGNMEIGIEAVNHGADAVYIGAPRFSARASAGNSLDDIRKLTEYAHTYWAKVYVALNTILYDSEFQEVEKMIGAFYAMGVDALIIQDMGILNLDLPPIPLHASTQCDNRNIEKIRFLENAGFSQAILARELSLREIKEIAGETKMNLEVFIHGALCVSYSGQCYISQNFTGRSANRGECAQFCRLPYTLIDASGKVLVQSKHLLSLKDLNRTEHLEELLDAGVSSLKIEGRLKETAYVKNVTAWYRQKLDAIFEKRPEYTRASSGRSVPFFVPDPQKSFNRGFTAYFLNGRDKNSASPYTPKSQGEAVGNVKDLGRNYFTVSGQKILHNGDGLCFINERKELQGFRVNRVEGNRIFPAEMPVLRSGISLSRNYDHEFEKTLSKKSAERKIGLVFDLEENNFGFTLTATDEDDCRASVTTAFPKEQAQKNAGENILYQLSKLGNTPFELEKLNLSLQGNRFIPSSILSELKRQTVERLLSARKIAYFRKSPARILQAQQSVATSLSYLANVANAHATTFYVSRGAKDIMPAFEIRAAENVPLMFTKHCILYQSGRCKKDVHALRDYKEPLYLLSGKNRLVLQFDCNKCEMQVLSSPE
ncbi:MAG: U32 family peptidase [Dysgonamonadaceae bacterium]|jgi:putative protease|nr:U32 family peptidase [Dysgonamonadaceae bacterium]